MQQPQQHQEQELVFQKFDTYDFEADPTFQSGLKSIVSNHQNKTAKEQEDAVQNAKYFYFSRFVQSFDYNQYRAWKASKTTTGSQQESTAQTLMEENSVPATLTETNPSYPKSFQEICELIASGKPIPGIRQIPNNLAEGTPSAPKLAPKLKPWEKAAAAAATSASETAEDSKEETQPALGA